MVRSNQVRVSDDEMELLEEVRREEFGTDSVPLGEVIDVACSGYLKCEDE